MTGRIDPIAIAVSVVRVLADYTLSARRATTRIYFQLSEVQPNVKLPADRFAALPQRR